MMKPMTTLALLLGLSVSGLAMTGPPGFPGPSGPTKQTEPKPPTPEQAQCPGTGVYIGDNGIWNCVGGKWKFAGQTSIGQNIDTLCYAKPTDKQPVSCKIGHTKKKWREFFEKTQGCGHWDKDGNPVGDTCR